MWYIEGPTGYISPQSGPATQIGGVWLGTPGTAYASTELKITLRPGKHKVYIGNGSCSGNYREVWYSVINVQQETCQVFPISFRVYNNHGAGKIVEFFDGSFNTNTTLGASGRIYYGDGDSSVADTYPRHVYSKSGTYQVTVRYTAADGCTKEFTQTVFVPLCDVKSYFNIQNDSVQRSKVSITGLTTGGTAPYSYKWKISNGDTSTGNILQYSFSRGIYKITMEVTDANKCIAVFDSTLSFTDDDACKLIAAFSSVTDQRNFSATPVIANNPDLTYNWSYGDGSSSGDYVGTHTFQSDGKFDVCLTVDEIYGCSRQVCRQIEILTVFSADVILSPNPATNSLTIQFSLEDAIPLEITLLNQSGLLVRTLKHDGFRGPNVIRLDIADLKTGLYTVQIHTQSRTIIKRFLKI